MNIRLIKQIDAWLGRLLTALLPSPSKTADCSCPRSILLIRPGGIGDAVLLAPAIGAIKKRFPDATITVLVERRNAGVFDMIPGIDRILRYDVPREFLAAFRLKPDVIIDTEQWHRLSAVVARLTGTSSSRIGFASNERARLFHQAIPYSHDDYEANSFLHLLSPLGITPPASLEASPFLSVPAVARTRADQLLAPLARRPFITLFPGASIEERRWGAERFRQIAVRLAERGYGIVVVGGMDDTLAGNVIVNNTGGLNIASKTSLAETAAIIERAALLVSGDSGVLHLGVGLGTPTVSLFGPGIAKKWAPRGPQHLVLSHHLPCSPCTKFGYTQKCQHNAECLKKITAEEVVQAALLLLPK